MELEPVGLAGGAALKLPGAARSVRKTAAFDEAAVDVARGLARAVDMTGLLLIRSSVC